MTTYEAFMRDARAESNADSTRVRAAFDAMYECCRRMTALQGPAESVVSTALFTLLLSADDKDKVRELCTWALHAAPLGPLPLRPGAAVALALRVHGSAE
jgi:DNA-directed RNA polymerase specialized sigma24 family protein